MKELLDTLKVKHLTLGSVESMTGGLFASEFTSISGASSVFKGSLVTYMSSEKIALAHVNPLTINKYTVVSKEVAIEMAKGGKEVLDVDLCISVTGNAGPTSDIGDKPVGEIHLAIAYLNNVFTKELHLKGERNEIRHECVNEMKNFILSILKE